MNRKLSLVVLLLLGVCLAVGLSLRAAETEEQRMARLQAMLPHEKEELARKKVRYDNLTAEEKERLKRLNEEIASDPNAPQLQEVMDRYHEWLKTLSASQLAELRDMPEADRLERIKRIMREQQRRTFLQIAREASPEDLEVVYEWNKEFIEENRERLLRSLPGEFGRRIAENPDKDRQTLILMYIMLTRPPRPDHPRPGKEEVEKLIPRLSPESQRVFNDTPDIFTRIQLLSIWSWGALWGKAFPNVTSQQLAEVFAKIPSWDRDRLEKMTPADRDQELRLKYAQMNFFRPGEGFDRLPWGDGRDPRRGRGEGRGGEPRPGEPGPGGRREGGPGFVREPGDQEGRGEGGPRPGGRRFRGREADSEGDQKSSPTSDQKSEEKPMPERELQPD
jgi:hypothetical protein